MKFFLNVYSIIYLIKKVKNLHEFILSNKIFLKLKTKFTEEIITCYACHPEVFALKTIYPIKNLIFKTYTVPKSSLTLRTLGNYLKSMLKSLKEQKNCH